MLWLSCCYSADRERADSASEDSESENDEVDEPASWDIDGQCCGAVKVGASVISQVPSAKTICRETNFRRTVLKYQQGPEWRRQRPRKQQREREG